MTLNGIVARIKGLAEAHSQIRSFYRGMIQNALDDSDRKFGLCILQINGGGVNASQKIGSINFRMFLLDLMHKSEETKENELEVQSDMMSVAMDLIAQMDDSVYTDWRIESNNTIEFLSEEGPDNVGGVAIDFTISAVWDLNRCAVPTN